MRSWWEAVLVVTGLELRQRVRSTRWWASLAGLFATVSVFVFGSLYLAVSAGGARYVEWAEYLYLLVVGVVLFFGIIIAPTLSATSISGDRRDATLALVQATPITNWQLTTGKLLGSWAASMALPLACTPYLIWASVSSATAVGWCLLGAVVVALLFGCFCAIGLGFSAVSARPTTSAVLTQLAVLFLVLGLPALFGLLVPATQQSHRVPGTDVMYTPSGAEPLCRDITERRTVEHTERTWWLLAPNPFLIVADIVGGNEPRPDRDLYDSPTFDMASLLSEARSGPYLDGQRCADLDDEAWHRRRDHDEAYLGRSWYWGLGINLMLGAGAFTLAARRLRVPVGKLPRGVRLA